MFLLIKNKPFISTFPSMLQCHVSTVVQNRQRALENIILDFLIIITILLVSYDL